ncbi:MAG: hypothetical protein U5L06_06240 [Rhodovibrio sp.]|nr:hypothetical protein [Rhodovibrio sp.]
MRKLALALAAVAGIAAAGLTGPAAAQSSGSEQSAQQSQQQTPNYSDAKLEVLRHRRHQGAHGDAGVPAAAAPGPAEPGPRAVREGPEAGPPGGRAEDRRHRGITTREYQQIAQDARNDDKLRQKVLGMMKAQQNQGQ